MILLHQSVQRTLVAYGDGATLAGVLRERAALADHPGVQVSDQRRALRVVCRSMILLSRSFPAWQSPVLCARPTSICL